MNRGRVKYSYSKLDRIMYKGVKLIKKGVLGMHKSALLSVGIAFKISELRVKNKEFIKLLKTKEGKVALKRVGAGATVVISLLGTTAAISEISSHIPEATAAEVSATIVEEAGDLDLDSRYKEYDITGDTTLSNMETTDTSVHDLDDVVTILHNADGSDYSEQILTSTGQKLNESGIEYYYANNNDELVDDIKMVDSLGKQANVVSIENGMNDGSQTLVASQYIRGQQANAPRTNSQTLAEEIVDNAPYSLYTDNGVASDIVEGERHAGIAQDVIINKRLEGENLPVDTLITVRPSSQDIYSPNMLGGNIADGIVDYYSENQNPEQKGPRL